MLVQARCMGNHTTPAVVAVGVSKAHTGARSIIGCKGLDVVGTANATKTKEIVLQTHADGLVPECLIQTTGHRVVERETHTIVKGDAIDVGLGLVVLITADAETSGAEGVARCLIEGIVGCSAQQCHLLGVSFLILELRFRQCHVGDGIAVLHHLGTLE